MLRLKRGDQVRVISGNDKGEQGQVLRVDHAKKQVIVQGVNLRYKHLRRSQKHPQGGRIQKEAPIHISNVMLIDPDKGTHTRVRIEEKGGKKVRIAVKSGKPV